MGMNQEELSKAYRERMDKDWGERAAKRKARFNKLEKVRSTVWFRLVKVIFIFFFLLAETAAIIIAWDLGTRKEYTATCVNGIIFETSYKPIRKFDWEDKANREKCLAQPDDSKDTAGLVSWVTNSEYTLTEQPPKSAAYAILAGTAVLAVFLIISRIFYYVAVG